MSAIFIVMAHVDYEGSAPVKAFAEKEDADEFVVQCHNYATLKPTPPSTIESTPKNDALWRRWDEADKKWRKSHPAPDEASADYFTTLELTLEGSKQ